MNPMTSYCVPCIYPLHPCGLQDVSAISPVSISVPGSKSITNRGLLLATLSRGTSILRGVLFSDDSRHFLKCIQDLGFQTCVDEPGRTITVTGLGGEIPLSEASQFVGSAGTAARFLTAYLGVSQGTYFCDASEQMRRRPMAPLLESLTELGCDVIFHGEEGHFPFTLKGHGFSKDEITIDIEHSSQFLSALLIASCLNRKTMTLHIKGSHGMSYIEMTRKMMEQFGVKTDRLSPDTFQTAAGQTYKAMDYQVEPDVSAACYFYALSPLLNIPVQVPHVHFDSLQGDVEFLYILEKMGCSLEDRKEGILVSPPLSGKFMGVDVNMSACSDQAITLAAIAPFADGPTTIRGIGHIRYQESNRMAAIVAQLGKMGILCRETEHNLTIFPGNPQKASIETYDDHRMAMGFSLTGLRAPGIVIEDPLCCRKTFEDYFQVLDHVVKSLSEGKSDKNSLTAHKNVMYEKMKSMGEDIKTVESIRKNAEQLAKTETSPRKEQQER